jgi:hypothetical protein
LTITNGYTSLAVYKQRFYDEGQGDTKDDAAIESVITAVSRSIDGICWQRFFTTAADETRYYTAEFSDWLRLPERIVTTPTTLKTDNDNDRTYENTWTLGTDYDLLPYNAVVDGEPFRWIELTPNGNYRFPRGIAKGVQIVGKFGWTAAPGQVVEACLLASHRLMARRNSPYGVSGAAAVGNLTLTVEKMKSDPDIMELLSPYIMRF